MINMKSLNKVIALCITMFFISNKAFALSTTDYLFLAEPNSLLIAVLMILFISLILLLQNVIVTLLKLIKKNKGKTLFVLTSLLSYSASAEMVDVKFYQKFDAYHFGIALTVLIIIIILYAQLRLIHKLVNELRGSKYKAKKVTKWALFIKKITDAKAIEKEADILLDHDYDGIKELDNNLPPWWIYSFYISIFFAIIYLGHYHLFNTGDLMIAEYQNEMLEAQQNLDTKKASGDLVVIDETNVEFLTDASSIEIGAKLYTSLCAACHGNEGQGLVGPNLTDAYWIHGGEFKEIFSSIKYGIPEKGMIAWKSQLSPGQIQKVTSFIMSIEGNTPPNSKAPEGNLVE